MGPELILLAAGSATPSLADAKDDYLAAGLAASNNNAELCACKSEEAAKIADELGVAQKEGHKEFKKPDEKKK